MRLLLLSAPILWCGVGSSHAQARPSMPQDAANLVVQVVVYTERGELDQVGAGIVLSAKDRVIIVTAAHVIRTAANGGKIGVVFFFARHDTSVATVERSDAEGDLAVLSVPPPNRAPGFSWDRRGDIHAAKSGDPVIPLGCPNGVCWEPAVAPDRFLRIYEQGFVFESFVISPGNSGGALFNRYWEVLGMVTKKADPQGRGLTIDQVADAVRRWGLPVALYRRRLPRAGYSTQVSLMGIAATEGSIKQAGRAPGGRASLLFRAKQSLGWHLAAVRLALANVAVTAALVGGDLRLERDRLALVPFVEVGLGRVEGRFDAGGYYIQGPTGTVYQPFWTQAKSDVVGVGGGASLEFMLLPHVAVEAIAGHWSFRPPSQVGSLPNAFLGAGLRLGF